MKFLNNSLHHRKIQWMSGVNGDKALLNDLAKKMDGFYGTTDGRSSYQEMLDQENSNKDQPEEIGSFLVNYIKENTIENTEILEVGCGKGNIYKFLRPFLYRNQYFGIEVAPHIIESNRKQFSNANWETATAYKIPYPDQKFDICFSHYVLEHLIHVEQALVEMMRVIKENGKLILVFPDFIQQNSVPSQFMGLSPMPTAKQRLRKGKILDALFSLWDSRIRIPFHLKRISRYGPFPLNVNPLCLIRPEYVYPDADAIYISSKNEIHQWAIRHHYNVNYPYGTEGVFRTQSFIVIQKHSGEKNS